MGPKADNIRWEGQVPLRNSADTRFGASGSEVGSRHQEQNREGGKAQSGQYMASWAGPLHLVSEPRTARLKVGGL